MMLRLKTFCSLILRYDIKSVPLIILMHPTKDHLKILYICIYRCPIFHITGRQVINVLHKIKFVTWSNIRYKVSITRKGLPAKDYLSRSPHERDPITGHLQWMKGHNSRAGIKIEVINASLSWGKAPELLYFITDRTKKSDSCITLEFMFHF